MALLTCNECGGKVSSDAEFCPHCGHRAQLEECHKEHQLLENLDKQIEYLEFDLQKTTHSIEEKQSRIRDYQFQLSVSKKKEDIDVIRKRIDWWNNLLKVDLAEEKTLLAELKELKDAKKRSKL